MNKLRCGYCDEVRKIPADQFIALVDKDFKPAGYLCYMCTILDPQIKKTGIKNDSSEPEF